MQNYIFDSPKKTFSNAGSLMNPETPVAPQKGFCLGKSSADKQDHFLASEWNDGLNDQKPQNDFVG